MTRKKPRALPDSSGSLIDSTDSDDRINNLPDSILSYILSFLPTKDAVATSILSQRWKLLWTTVINLEFCFPGDESYGIAEQGKSAEFVQFVNYVLLLHKPGCLNKLSLIWERKCIPFYVTAWISTAVARNVHNLLVCVYVKDFGQMIQVPRTMFNCEVLQSLELNFNFCISSEIVFSLPKLERLKLISVYFNYDLAFSKLLAGCPMLKYLYIDMDIAKLLRYLGKNIVQVIEDDGTVFKFVVSSISLRHLEIYVHYASESHLAISMCGVVLDAPSLEYIILGQISSISIQESLSSLVEANIEIDAFDSIVEEPNNCNSVVEVVSSLNSAEAITLSRHVIWALSCATVNLRTRFKRLSKLEVTVVCCDWSSLQDLIQLSDNLEALTVKKDIYCDQCNNWKKPNQVPKCLSNSLKIVTLSEYDASDNELARVAYILKHGSALKVMKICLGIFITDFKRKFEVVQQITKFPRKSPVCEVEVC